MQYLLDHWKDFKKKRLDMAGLKSHIYNYISPGGSLAPNACFVRQTPSLASSRQFKPASGKGIRLPVPTQRLLRSPGPRPGQVRDAAPSQSRQALREPLRHGLRHVPADVLSGPDGLPARWLGSFGATRAGAPWGAQAYPGSAGLYPPAAVGRTISRWDDTGRTDSRTLRRDDPSAQYRARRFEIGRA